MLNKALKAIASVCMVLLVAACSMFKDKSSVGSYNVKATEVMVFTPKNINLDKTIFEEGKVSQVVFPDDYDKDIDKTIENIKKIAKNSDVKALVIASGNNKIYSAFNEIKKEKSGLLTLAAGEYSNTISKTSRPIYLDTDIDLGFVYEKNKEGEAMAELAKNMGADEIIIYSRAENLKNKKISSQVESIRAYSDKNAIKNTLIAMPKEITNNDSLEKFMKDDLDSKLRSKNSDKLAVLSTDPESNKYILSNAKKYKYIVPGILGDVELGSVEGYKDIYNEAFKLGLNNDEIKNPSSYKKAMSKKMKELGLKSKIAGYSRTSAESSVDLAGIIAQDIVLDQRSIFSGYNEMFSETMSYENIYDVVNKYLDSFISFENTSNNSRYFKTIKIYPDIY